MKALLLLPLAACVSAQLVVPYGAVTPYAAAQVAAPWVPKSQYHSQDELGQFSFGHTTFDQSRSEVRLWNGQVLGHYSYIDANGEPAVTYYEAGPNGYRVLGANNLPEAPQANLAAPGITLQAPEPVQYTPEVEAARAEFLKVHAEAVAAAHILPAPPEETAAEEELASTSPDEPVAVEELNGQHVLEPNNLSEAPQDNLAVPVNTLEVPEYTPEVAAARAEFLKVHAQLVAAAHILPAPPGETAAEEKHASTAEEPAPAASRKKRQALLHADLPFAAHPTVLSTPVVKVAALKKVALHSPLVYSHLPFAPLVKAADGEEDLKIVSPFVRAPFLTYSAVKPVEIRPTLKATKFPYIYEPVEAEASSSRRKRDLTLPLPYLHAVPTTTKATFKTTGYEPQEAATPADTTKIDLVTKEHEVDIPSVKYVQPVVKYEPITYKTVALPSVLPYASYSFIRSPLVTLKAE